MFLIQDLFTKDTNNLCFCVFRNAPMYGLLESSPGDHQKSIREVDEMGNV